MDINFIDFQHEFKNLRTHATENVSRIVMAWSSTQQTIPGGYPIMAYTGRFCPEGVPFSGFGCIKVMGISQMEIYEGVGKSVI